MMTEQDFAEMVITITEDYAAGFISYREYLQQFAEINKDYGQEIVIGKVI